MKYLLDTSVINELIAKQPNIRVVDFVDSLEQEDMFLSVITVGEVARAIQKVPDPQRKQLLNDWMHEQLLVRFEGNILPLDAKVMAHWGEVYAKLENEDITLPAIDSMLLATALFHRLVLVTMNDNDFEGTGIEIVNPW